MYAEPGMTDYMEGLYEYEEELEYQKAYIENMYRFYGYGIWLVFEKKTGTLIGRAGVEHPGRLGLLRVYLKNEEDAPAVKADLDKLCPDLPIAYLYADVCREELLIEIEGIA